MTSHISQEDYQNLRKILQANSARRSSAAGKRLEDTKQKSNVPSRDGGVDPKADLTGVDRIKAGIAEGDSDSGYSGKGFSSNPDSSFSLMSSGTSVDSGPLQKDDGSSRELSISSEVSSSNVEHSESDDAHLNTEENVTVLTNSTPSSDFHDSGGGRLEEEEVLPSEGRDSTTRGDDGETVVRDDDVMQTTPSNLFRKMENRQSGLEAGGVGSFASFTSPSELFRRGEVEDGEILENKQSVDEDIAVGGHLGSNHQGEADILFDYSTPSKLLMIRHDRSKAESAAGVGSFESFTSPSALFRRKHLSSHIDMDHNELNKSSTELLNMNEDPSEILKKKTELIVLERIASAKVVDINQPSHEMLEDGSTETGGAVGRGGSHSRDEPWGEGEREETDEPWSGIGVDDINVQIQNDSSLEGDHHVTVDSPEKSEGKVLFQEKGCVSCSSESDISLIVEDAKANEDVSSSESDDQEKLDSFNEKVDVVTAKKHHAGCIWHTCQGKTQRVLKTRSYPLMQLTRNMLCCSDDPIRCECSDKKSVEKLVGLDIDDDLGQDLEEGNSSLENSHSWADATWRSLEMVIEKEHSRSEENQWEPPTWRPTKNILDLSPEKNQNLENQDKELLKSMKDELEALRKLKTERDWNMMEEKLEMSRKLLQQQREKEQEKTHLMQTHHKIVDEMLEKHQVTKLKVKEQEKEIAILREKVHKGEEDFQKECIEMERRCRAWNDCKANLEKQLISATEENATLHRLQDDNVGSLEMMQDKIHSLTLDLHHYKAECERLEEILSQQQLFTENASQQISSPSITTMETAHANICIELDEDQNKLTIETKLDRKFVCGDGTKSDAEIQEITENLTAFIRDEVVRNLFPLLYHGDPLLQKHGEQSNTPPSSSPTTERSHEAEAAVVISLDAENDTSVKIHAEMDAGFLGTGKKEEEVDDVVQSIAKYVKDHFLEGILMQLFPDKDLGSCFAVSSDVCSSSLHNLPSISGRDDSHLMKITCADEEDEEIIDSQELAKKQSEVIRRLEESLKETNAEVAALQGVVRKQEMENAKLEEKYERRGAQLKDVFCQFSESERQWMEEKDALGQKIKEKDAEVEALQGQLEEIQSDRARLSEELEGKISDVTDSELKLKKHLEERMKELKAKEEKLIEMEEKLQAETQASMELKNDKEDLFGKLNEKQEELTTLSAQYDTNRLALEEQLRCYEVVLKEKDDTVAKLSILQVGKDLEAAEIDEKKILEQLVTSLKAENLKLRSHLQTLALSGMHSSTVTTPTTFKKQEAQSSNNVSIPWEQYQVVMGEKHQLSVMVDKLEHEKQDQMIWGKMLEEKVHHFQLEISNLKEKIQNLTGDLEKAIQETQGLRQKLMIDEIKADLKLQTKLTEVEKNKAEMERNLEEKVTSLNIEKGQLVSEKSHWQEDVRLLKEEKKTLLDHLEECNKKLSICQEDLKTTTEQLNVKEADLRGAKHQIEEMTKERDKAVSRLGDLYQNLMNAQADIEKTQESKKRDVDRLQSQITALEKDLLCNKKDLEQAQNNLAAVKSELEQRNNSHKKKVDTIEKLQEEKDLIQTQITVLEEKLEQKETGAFVITDSLVKKQEEVDCLQNRLFAQSSELAQIREALSDKTRSLEEERGFVENLKAELMQLTQDKGERVHEMRHLEEKNSEQEEKMTEFEETIEELHKENDRLRHELQDVEQEKEDLSNSVEKLEQQYQKLYENHTRLDCKSESDVKFNDYLQGELEKSKSIMDRLKDKTRELKREMESNEEVYNEQEEKLKRALSKSQQEVVRLQQSLNDAEKSIEALQETGKEQAERLTDEQEQIASLTTDLEQLQKEFMAERKLVQKLGEEKEQMRAQLDDKIEKLSNEKNSLQEEIFQAKLSAKVGRVKHGQVGSQLKQLRQCIDEQIENNIKNVEQNAALKKDIERLQEQNAGLNSTIDCMRKNEEESVEEMSDRKKEICDLSDRLTQAEHQSRTYQNKIEELQILLQNERMLVASLRKVNKEKKKKWLLNNQLFSSKVKTQLQTDDEKIAQLEDDLVQANHESQLQRCELSEKSQVIQRLQEKIVFLEDNQSGLEEDLRRAESQIRKDEDLVKVLNDRLLQCHEEMKSNLKQKWGHGCNNSPCQLDHSSNPGFDFEAMHMYDKMKMVEAEMKKNIKEEVKDHVKQITRQILPSSTPTDARIEDIASEISKMKLQRQWEKEKMDSIAMNIDKLNLTVQNEMLNSHQKKSQNVRSSSTPAEVSRAIRAANMRALSRANNSKCSNCACFQDQTDGTTFLGPEASVINDSTVLAGSSADVFYSPQQASPTHNSTRKRPSEFWGNH